MKTEPIKLTPSTRATKTGRPSRFAPFDNLLRELFAKFPSESGKAIDFKAAFAAEPDLEKTLGVQNDPKGTAALRFRVSQVIVPALLAGDALNGEPKAKSRKKQGRAGKPVREDSPKVKTIPIMPHCPNCAFNLRPVATAYALALSKGT